MSHWTTGDLWERVGYLSAQPLGEGPALKVVRVVLTAIDEDSTGDVVKLLSDVTAAFMPKRASAAPATPGLETTDD